MQCLLVFAFLALPLLVRADNVNVTDHQIPVTKPVPVNIVSGTIGEAGLATAEKQDTGNASLASIDLKIPTKGAANTAASLPVTLAQDQAAILIRGPHGTSNYSVTRSSASTTAATWIAARATRRAATLYNLSTTITIYFKDESGTVTSSNGFPLGPGQSKTVNITGAIQVIAASGTPALVADEEYD